MVLMHRRNGLFVDKTDKINFTMTSSYDDRDGRNLRILLSTKNLFLLK